MAGLRCAWMCAIIALASCTAPAPRNLAHPTLASIDAGRRVAMSKCASCHAIDDMADSPNRAAPAFRTLWKRYPINALRQALAKGIIEGNRHMPQLHLNRADTDAVADYLESIQERRGA